jgi:hypothetical protein
MSMSLEDAKRTLRGMGNTVWRNTPGPSALWQGFLQTHVFSPAAPFLVLIVFMLLFGEPIIHWLTPDTPFPSHRVH